MFILHNLSKALNETDFATVNLYCS